MHGMSLGGRAREGGSPAREWSVASCSVRPRLAACGRAPRAFQSRDVNINSSPGSDWWRGRRCSPTRCRYHHAAVAGEWPRRRRHRLLWADLSLSSYFALPPRRLFIEILTAQINFKGPGNGVRGPLQMLFSTNLKST
ncbi:hypothetical protein CIHG_05898 [Coccidioides immitis H538.4]|uniref:Uncharacterized protein n=3 Tax=Coccidioides immitis TaxID=5501 RepID=A0A0J8QLJ9_COCIT|nr:hypothetical protein CIRG_01960 [Coccidioides immitis RMSCC 2394]KMU73289.1 hypothetical protein CISG_10005 [Coccidioides immitis RMSCC 3703]KMU88130.1 hypothetical protein CIHG_05898 [Coccidioides immitis H538.4]